MTLAPDQKSGRSRNWPNHLDLNVTEYGACDVRPCRLPLTLNEASEPALDRSWRSGQADHRAPSTPKMDLLLQEHDQLASRSNLTRTIQDVQKTIDLLTRARDTVAEGMYTSSSRSDRSSRPRKLIGRAVVDPSSASITLAKLQNPVKQSFDVINGDLKEIYNGLGRYQKVLDKVGRRRWRSSAGRNRVDGCP